jgi:DNA replication protein DnaC
MEAHLELRQEFQGRHMRGTAIELSNRQNTGWAQSQNASAILEITYPSSDVRRALEAVSTSSSGKSVVMIGQRGSGKSHIMALIRNLLFLHRFAGIVPLLMGIARPMLQLRSKTERFRAALDSTA